MNHFRNFNGFGEDGIYIGHYEGEEPVKVAERVLSEHVGRKAVIRYNDITLEPTTWRKMRKDKSFDPSQIFDPVQKVLTIPQNGLLKKLLERVNTDNIEIDIIGVGSYEIQRIVFGNQFTSELRQFR